MKKKGKRIACNECGKKVYVYPSKLKPKNYCSRDCSNLGKKTNTESTCLSCGGTYYVSVSQKVLRNRNTCSFRCRNEFTAMGNKGRTKIERSVRSKKRKFKKGGDLNLNQLKVKLDQVFSRYIRNRDNWTCYTCGKKGIGSQIHCGHFISRTHMSTRYDEMNCHAQCAGCNMFKAGNMGEYSYRLMQEFGQEKFNALIMLGRTVRKFTTSELSDLIEVYKKKVEEQNV